AGCDHRETECCGQDGRRKRGGKEALSRSLHRRARRQRARARSAWTVGDARRREIQKAAGREEVDRRSCNEKAPSSGAFYYLPVIICQLLSASYYLPGVEPGPAGAMVEPLGDGLMRVFPDGFSSLFCPAAALPALFVMPVPAA